MKVFIPPQPSVSWGNGLVRTVSRLLQWKLIEEWHLTSWVCRYWLWIWGAFRYTIYRFHRLLICITVYHHIISLCLYLLNQWSYPHFSRTSSSWGWKSVSKYQITFRTVSSHSVSLNQGATRTSPVFAVMQWNTCLTSFPKDRYAFGSMFDDDAGVSVSHSCFESGWWIFLH